MIISDGKSKHQDKPVNEVMENDCLDITKLNSLPHPLMYISLGETESPGYYIESICVETALCCVDVCGQIDRMSFVEFDKIIDANGIEHDASDFWID